MNGPWTIVLTDKVKQESPVAFLVFSCQHPEEYRIIVEESQAQEYAAEQEEKAGALKDSWPIYALWASDWPG